MLTVVALFLFLTYPAAHSVDSEITLSIELLHSAVDALKLRRQFIVAVVLCSDCGFDGRLFSSMPS